MKPYQDSTILFASHAGLPDQSQDALRFGLIEPVFSSSRSWATFLSAGGGLLRLTAISTSHTAFDAAGTPGRFQFIDRHLNGRAALKHHFVLKDDVLRRMLPLSSHKTQGSGR